MAKQKHWSSSGEHSLFAQHVAEAVAHQLADAHYEGDADPIMVSLAADTMAIGLAAAKKGLNAGLKFRGEITQLGLQIVIVGDDSWEGDFTGSLQWGDGSIADFTGHAKRGTRGDILLTNLVLV